MVWITPERHRLVRDQLASWFGLPPHRTAVTFNVSSAVTCVLAALDLRPGHEILVTDNGYGAVTMAAQRAAHKAAGKVITATLPLELSSQQVAEAVTSAMTERTALVIVDQITSPTGRVLPATQICNAARARGIISLVDAAHAAGMMAEPFIEAADFWTTNLHKYPCTPRGTGLLVARELAGMNLEPPIGSWSSDEPFPSSFDYQATLDTTAWLAAPDAVEFLDQAFGWDEIRRYATRLADWAQSYLAEQFQLHLGAPEPNLFENQAPAMRLVPLPGGIATTREQADALRDKLAAHGLESAFTAYGGRGYLRLSTHAYNTATDYVSFGQRSIPIIADELSRLN